MPGNPSYRKDTLALHVSVMLFGMAGLLGKAVSVSPLAVVFARAAMGAFALMVWLLARQWIATAPRQGAPGTAARGELAGLNAWTFAGLAVSGVVLAIHWLAFFRSIQVSTVAVGLLSFGTFPIFMALMDPLCSGGRLGAIDLARACLVGVGMAIVVPEYDLQARVTRGVIWGVFSALTFAGLAMVNRRLSHRLSPRLIAAGQNAVAAIALAPAILLWPPVLTKLDLARLVVLGIVCTALAHALYIQGLRSVRIPVVGVVTALEPVYGMLLAAILLGEVPSPRSIAGGAIIIGLVLWTAASRSTRVPAAGRPDGTPP